MPSDREAAALILALDTLTWTLDVFEKSQSNAELEERIAYCLEGLALASGSKSLAFDCRFSTDPATQKGRITYVIKLTPSLEAAGNSLLAALRSAALLLKQKIKTESVVP